MPMIDPVCHREVDDVEYPGREEYKGKTYFFCSLEHEQQFFLHPEQYADDEDEEENADYTGR